MQPTGLVQNAMAFGGLPLAFFVTSSGLGLLVDRVTRARLPNELLAPVGLCAAASLMLSVFTLGGHIQVAVAVLVATSTIGYALAGRSWRRALELGWTGMAALAVYCAYVLPMAATGGWTWLGYNFLNDTSVQFALIEHLKHFGAGAVGLPGSTGGQTVGVYLETGYPLGAHSYAAALSGLLAQPIEVVYQSFLAALAAAAAMGLGVVARAATGARVAAVLGACALASNLTFQFAMQGSIKEIATLATLSAACGVLVVLVGTAATPVGLAAVLGVCLAGVLSVYSAAGLPYVVAIGATTIALVLATRGRAALRPVWVLAAGLAITVAVVASAASLVTLREFYAVASKVVAAASPGGSALGQLAHPLDLLQTSGVWLKGRYFEPIEPNTFALTLTLVAAWLIAALVAYAVIELLRTRRRPELAALTAIAALGLAAAVVAPRVTPYADAKLFAILSPAVVLTAGIGASLLWRWARPLAGLVVVALIAAIGVSDALAYHDDKPAPVARMAAISEAVAHTPGGGLILFTEFEEFAKYFDPFGRLDVASDSITPRPVVLRNQQDRFGRSFDLDAQTLAFVQSFANIILRRSPQASRPPSGFRIAYVNTFYEVWTRDPARPSALVHLPLGDNVNAASGLASCAAVRGLVGEARRTRVATELVAAQPPQTLVMDAPHAPDRSPGWPPDGATPDTLTLAGPGHALGSIAVARRGRYAVWVRGDLPRRVEVAVDGRVVGSARGINTPGQWLPAGAADLSAGRAAVRVFAGGGTLNPGDGALGLLGPVAFVREEPPRLLHVSLGAAHVLCGKLLDWIEVAPRGA